MSFSLYTQEWYMSHRLKLQLANRIRTERRPDPVRKLSPNLYDIYHCCAHTEKKTPDDGQRNCPKHVEFYSKNKFEKLVHLVGFIIRIFGRNEEFQNDIAGDAYSNHCLYKGECIGYDKQNSQLAWVNISYHWPEIRTTDLPIT